MAVLQAPVDPLSEHSRDEDMEDNRGTSLFGQAISFITDCLLEVLITRVSITVGLFDLFLTIHILNYKVDQILICVTALH